MSEEENKQYMPKTYPIRTTAGRLDKYHRAARISGYRSLREWVDAALDRQAAKDLSRIQIREEEED